MVLAVSAMLTNAVALAAPYAAMVMDARSGKVLHSRNADTQLHPASLTKMMTLYIAFEAVENGEISLDTLVTVSARAAAEPPSKLGLRRGQKIKLRYLIRAAAIKSANDAATAIGEAISGSEAAFARRMNRTARAMGMTRTHFKNAHGLTESGHLSTARDMTVLGRQLFYDYPQYYNLFSRLTANAGVKRVAHTNTRFLNAYRGADGIKTGYTRAAGYNLVASAERGSERIITTVFGGRSVASRNAKVAELMDLGFRRAPTRVALRRPSRPAYQGADGPAPGATPPGKTIRVVAAPATSPRPIRRPVAADVPDTLIAELETSVAEALEEATPGCGTGCRGCCTEERLRRTRAWPGGRDHYRHRLGAPDHADTAAAPGHHYPDRAGHPAAGRGRTRDRDPHVHLRRAPLGRERGRHDHTSPGRTAAA